MDKQTESGKQHILYMEDDKSLAALVQRRLQRYGFTVKIAPDGESGLQQLKIEHFDVVVLDYNMPKLDGMTVLKQLVIDESSPPAIMVSGVGSLEIAVEAMRLGAADYVVKETGGNYLQLLPGVIAKVLEKQRLIQEKVAAEVALKESEQRFRSVTESVVDAIISADGDGNIIFWNRGAGVIFGYKEAEIIGQPLTLLMPEKFQMSHTDALQQVRETNKMPVAGRMMELDGLRKDGSLFPMEISLSSWLVGEKKLFSAVIRDITARRQAEQHTNRLLQTKIAVNALLQSATESHTLDTQLKITLDLLLAGVLIPTLRKGAIYLLDDDSGEMVLKTQQGLSEQLLKSCNRVKAGQCLCGKAVNSCEVVFSGSATSEHSHLCRDLEPHSHYCVPISSEGKILGAINLIVANEHKKNEDEEEFLNTISNTLSGIIVRQRTEKNLQLLNERYRLLLETSKFVPWELELANNRYTYMGPQIEELLGFSASDWQDFDAWAGYLHHADRDKAIRACREARARGEDHDLEYRMLAAGGRVVWIRDIATIIGTATDIQGLRGIFIDITDSKKQEETLRQSKLAAESANHAKSTFLATMSHEIRTPMNAILGMGEVLKESGLTPEQLNTLKVITYAGENLLSLINDILDLSKVEAGQLQIESTSFDLYKLAAGIHNIFCQKAKDKNITFDYIIQPGCYRFVVGDNQRLRQVLLNLLGNAIKFTENGRVMLKMEYLDRDHIGFTVSDTGIGIAKEHLSHIFEPFRQADDSTSRRFGGTGLGLSICHRLVAAMGGKIQVESKIGLGSVFRFSAHLPRSPTQSTDETTSTTCSADKLNNAADNAATPPLNILLVDDADDNRLVIKSFLINTQHQVTEASNGAEAVERFQADKYDMVLMDMQMPVLDGFAATQQIRKWEKDLGKPPVPIVALTANAMKDDQDKTAAVGCNVHLSKPVRKARLLAVINQFSSPHQPPPGS